MKEVFFTHARNHTHTLIHTHTHTHTCTHIHTHTHTEPPPSDELLRVQFAGVAIAEPEMTEQWLGQQLMGRGTWFTLLHRTDDQRAVQCIVQAKKVSIRVYEMNGF